MSSRWAMLGSQIGAGLSKGLMDKYAERQFGKQLQNKVNQIRNLNLEGLNPAQLSLLGIKQQSQGSPLDAALAAIVMSQLGNSQQQPLPKPQPQPLPPPSIQPPPTDGVEEIISQDMNQQAPFGVYRVQLDGVEYELAPYNKEQVDEIVSKGGKRIL